MAARKPFAKHLHRAMATEFVIFVDGMAEQAGRDACRAAFDEIDRIELALSRFDPRSAVAAINRLKAGESIRVGWDLFECLKIARRIHDETAGAFDPAIGALLEAMRAADRGEPGASVAQARERSGMNALLLEERQHEGRAKEFIVNKTRDGVALDLGGIGKGYALDVAREALESWDAQAALLSAGESTLLPIGRPEGRGGWPVRLGAVPQDPLSGRKIELAGRALSGSSFEMQGRHILDPRTGRWAAGKAGAWALAPAAAEADALSTAFLVMNREEVEALCARRPEIAALLALQKDGGVEFVQFNEIP